MEFLLDHTRAASLQFRNQSKFCTESSLSLRSLALQSTCCQLLIPVKIKSAHFKSSSFLDRPNQSPSAYLHFYTAIMRQASILQVACLLAAITIPSALAFAPSTSVPSTPFLQQQQQKYRLPTADQQNHHTSNNHNHPNVMGQSPLFRRATTSSSLSMVPQIAALAGCLSGGFFAGGLHAIAGEYDENRSLSFYPTRVEDLFLAPK